MKDPRALEEIETKLRLITETLKSEFAGVDAQIDEIVGAMKLWYVLPEAMRRPLIVNLWGTTGVGKTSLLLRMCELLEVQQCMAYFDMGKFVDRSATQLSFHSLGHLSGNKSIFILDDIHTARSFDSYNAELDRPMMRDFWSLLDSGVIARDGQLVREYVARYKDSLRTVLQQKKTNPEFFDPSTILSHWETEEMPAFIGVPPISVDPADPEAWIRAFIKTCEEVLHQRQVFDFRKSIVFITGNLDGVIQSATPETDADKFRALTQKVTRTDVQRVLHSLFRPEQVARMGSKHIFFPSLSSESFRKVIRNRLTETRQFVSTEFSLSVDFDKSVEDYAYQTGVFPSQGCRPLLSNLNGLIDPRLPSVILRMLEHSKSHAVVSIKDDILVLKAGELVILEETLPREEVIGLSPEMKKIVAVHEAGHAVVGIGTLGLLPAEINSNGKWPGPHGTVCFGYFQHVNRRSVEDYLQMQLGGFRAEALVFGEGFQTAGSTSDLMSATSTAAQAITEWGFGSHPAVTSLRMQQPELLTSHKTRDDREVVEWLSAAEKGATAVLLKQWDLFRALSLHLEQFGSCDPETLKTLFRTHFKGDGQECQRIMERKVPRHIEHYENGWQDLVERKKVA